MKTIALHVRQILAYQFSSILYGFSFAIPLLFSSPQIITGTVVNCLLFLSVQRLSKKELIPLVVLPSLGAVAHGVLFGPQTIYLYYFLPFIWLGNYLLIHLFSSFRTYPYVSRVVISAVSKYLLLQLFAQLFFHNHIVPSVFVISMGYIQLFTALLGGLLSYGIISTFSYERRQNTH